MERCCLVQKVVGFTTVSSIVFGLMLSLSQAQEEAVFEHRAPTELPDAVKSATVEAELRKPGGANGGDLVIRRIQPPRLPKDDPKPRIVIDPERKADEGGDKVVGDQPLETKWFIPTIELYPDGVSLVHWQSWSRKDGWRGYAAWVALDLSSIRGCGDFEIGDTAYNLIGITYPASNQRRGSPAVPRKGQLVDGYLVTKGNADDAEAMEPLLAVIQLYAQEGDDIRAEHQAIVARKAVWEKWNRENPEPSRDTEISFWPIKSSEYSTEPAR